MWEKFGVGAVIIILAALYFIVRQAVKDGIKEAYKDITGKKRMRIWKQKKDARNYLKKTISNQIRESLASSVPN